MASIAVISFTATGYLSMYYAEIDFHLMYLTNVEESRHPFFQMCMMQGALAIFTAYFHLLNVVLFLDVLLMQKDLTESQILVRTRR